MPIFLTQPYRSYIMQAHALRSSTRVPASFRASVPHPMEVGHLATERLPFTVRVATDTQAMHKAISLRQSAYQRHVPELANKLQAPESHDLAPGVAVLLAESKLDGQPLGTMRIQTNSHEPLWLEQSVTLPEWLGQQALAEATRLGVTLGSAGRLAKTAIFKAYYLYCVQAGIDYMVIAGRSPLDRQYEALLFEEVFPDVGFIPMQHAGNIPHRVLSFEVATAQERWRAARHPLYRFVFETHHPDIIVTPSRQRPLHAPVAVAAQQPAMAAE